MKGLPPWATASVAALLTASHGASARGGDGRSGATEASGLLSTAGALSASSLESQTGMYGASALYSTTVFTTVSATRPT